MGVSDRLYVLARVLAEASGAGRRELPRIFSGVEIEWFDSVNHFEELYSYVYDKEGVKLWVARAGSYLVVSPSLEDEGVRLAAHRLVEWLGRLLHGAFGEAAHRGDASEDFIAGLRDAAKRLLKYGGGLSNSTRAAAGVTLFYLGVGRVFRLEAYDLRAAIVGVNSDTGRLFTKILPPGSALAAWIVRRDLKRGSVDAARALLGFDRDVTSWRGEDGVVVRLQGDLYVRVYSYLWEGSPEEWAKGFSSAWSSAEYIEGSLGDLILEASARSRSVLEGYGGDKRLSVVLRALAVGIEQAARRVYPWLVGVCSELELDCFNPSERLALKLAPAERPSGVEGLLERRLGNAVFQASPESVVDLAGFLPRPPKPVESLTHASSLMKNDVLSPREWSPARAFLAAFARASAALRALALWASLERLDEEEVDNIARRAEAYTLSILSKEHLSGGLLGPRLRYTEVHSLLSWGSVEWKTIPEAIADALQHLVLNYGEKAEMPGEVVKAVEEASTYTRVEVEAGRHTVTVEGYLLEGLVAEGVELAMRAYDLAVLWAAAASYDPDSSPDKSPERGLKHMILEGSGPEEHRIAAAAALSRLLAAPTDTLLVVTPGGGTTVEARHPEHGTATLELEEPALIAVYTAPSFPQDRLSPDTPMPPHLRRALWGGEDEEDSYDEDYDGEWEDEDY